MEDAAPPPTASAPDGGVGAMQPSPVYDWMAAMIQEYFMFIVVGGFILYLCRERISLWFDNRQSLAIHAAAKQKTSEEERMAGLRAARERQQQYAAQCALQDAALREEKKQKEAEEKAKLLQKMKDEMAGRTTAGAAAAAAGQEGVSKLPKLPGGDRDTYRPSGGGGGSSGGGRYRPTGFQRPAGGGG